MHYYSHHIGDFIRDTSRLTDSQCMAYLRLIWIYYDTETPLSDDADSLAFQIGASASDVRQILDHFFDMDANAMRTHKRCERELSEYRGKAEKARNSANARWSNANAMRTHTERNANAPKSDANQEPITNNQEKTKNKEARAPRFDAQAHLSALGVSDSVVADWLTLRKDKKASVTLTAISGIEREAAKARLSMLATLSMCCERGWTGFKAEWVEARAGPAGHLNAKEESRAAAARAFMPQTQGPRHDNRTIDITPAASPELGFQNLHEDAGALRQPVD